MYKHRLVQRLWEFVEMEVKPRAGSSPILNAIYFGMKHEIPNILRNLDESPEAVEAIRKRLMKILEEEEEEMSEEGLRGSTEVGTLQEGAREGDAIPEGTILDE